MEIEATSDAFIWEDVTLAVTEKELCSQASMRTMPHDQRSESWLPIVIFPCQYSYFLQWIWCAYHMVHHLKRGGHILLPVLKESVL